MRKYCFEKLMFLTRDEAEAQIVKNYKRGHKSLGVYECPYCLAFHTTSKYDNRSFEVIAKCILPITTSKQRRKRRHLLQTLITTRMNEMYDRLNLPKHYLINNKYGSKRYRRMLAESMEQTLPLIKQKEIWSRLNQSST